MRDVHPLIRVGGPILGAILLIYLISGMISQFQADQEAARRTPLPVAGAEEPAETPVAEGIIEPETEETETLPVEEEPAEVAEPEEVEATPEIVDPEVEEEPAPEEEITDDPAQEETAITEEETEDIATEETATEEATTAEVTEPTTLAEMTPEQILAGLPDEVAAFFPEQVDPSTGQQLALSTGCTACHSLEEGVAPIGPSWYNIGNVAVTRVEGESPALYLYNSIVDPNHYVVEGFLPGLMPQNYDSILNDEQMAHLVAYLLTLRED
jgi:mono/diheme cytochrome c family protein